MLKSHLHCNLKILIELIFQIGDVNLIGLQVHFKNLHKCWSPTTWNTFSQLSHMFRLFSQNNKVKG